MRAPKARDLRRLQIRIAYNDQLKRSLFSIIHVVRDMVVICGCPGFLIRKLTQLTTYLSKIFQPGSICDDLNFTLCRWNDLEFVLLLTQTAPSYLNQYRDQQLSSCHALPRCRNRICLDRQHTPSTALAHKKSHCHLTYLRGPYRFVQ